jgi:cyclic beta-1,2-glucan synthetase
VKIQYIIYILVFLSALISTFLIGLNYSRNKKLNNLDSQATLLTVEELESHAKQMALEHSVKNSTYGQGSPIVRMNENYMYIHAVYKLLSEDAQKNHAVPQAAEWLLDNFYVIEEQVKSIRQSLNKEEYSKLPILKNGVFKGHTRVYSIAMELVSHSDGKINDKMLQAYLNAYQTHSILYDREIWIIPTMIRIALIENARQIVSKIRLTRNNWRSVDELISEYWLSEREDTDNLIKALKPKIGSLYGDNVSFIEHLFYRLRRSGKSYIDVLRFIDETLAKYGTSTTLIAQKEHNIQANMTVSMGNSVESIKYIATHNWTNLFENVSFVEQILRKDPNDVYLKMDVNSRNYYRIEIERFAKRFSVSELHIAKEILMLAQRYNETQDNPYLKIKQSHVGYYIIGEGKKELEERQKNNDLKQKFINYLLTNQPGSFYIGFILLCSMILITLALLYAYLSSSYTILTLVLVFISVLLPASEIAITFVNWVVVKIKRPNVFVRLDLTQGISDDLSTIVIVPVILSNEKRISEILENLENHYISNTEKNLYFALIGAFKDYSEHSASDDQFILDKTASGIKALNRKYSSDEKDIFYYYHRDRQFNEKDDNWTGWERKRGALMEFNEILLGRNGTSFTYFSNNDLAHKAIKYVITLDADTILPMGMAKRMIGTMAHPMNLPIIDSENQIVTQGYGLMQPRVSFDIESSNKSLFSRIFTGQEGIDPYASAISDVYQDLFDEGIFTGKGIYDLNVFQKVLNGRIPLNSVLSHDLLEGSYVRAALVSDMELIDEYPSKYNAYMGRMYRWIRGDWQLLPWLGKHTYNRKNEKSKNPLSLLSNWKIFDNLRRSLVSSSILFLLLMGSSVLPGHAGFYALFALLTIALPFLLAFIDRSIASGIFPNQIKRHISGYYGLKALFFQLILRITFISHQSNVSLKAIGVTLFRVFITKKNMLEWVTSADAEKNQRNSLASYYKSMGISTLNGVILFMLAYRYKPEMVPYSFIVLVVWLLAPYCAYRISLDKHTKVYQIPLSDRYELRKIARKTWRYFEEFSNFKSNYLIPDNYQEDPPRGVAHRTSPTDIGLGLSSILSAYDMGYISLIESIDLLNNTIRTVEALEKWNGHLYNWYDTRSLKPLHPIYVSTVDNGNYVGYLITIIQGLKAFMTSNVFDKRSINGIRDTLANGLLNETEINRAMENFDGILSEESIDAQKWVQALHQFKYNLGDQKMSKSAWEYKLMHMIDVLIDECNEFMPWLDHLNYVPESIKQNEAYVDLIKTLSQNPNLAHKQIYFNDLNNLILKFDQSIDRTWISDLKILVLSASQAWDKCITNMDDLMRRMDKLSWDTNFSVLFDNSKQLFSIGYNVSEQKLTNSYYDLLASESRQASYIAIARGEVPPKHWSMLGRSLTVVDRFKGLVSWSGTMFEYLMPLLIMKRYPNTLLDETYSFVIKSQIKYGKERAIPWGASESGYNLLDYHLDYQYKAIGVPWLGLKRGLVGDAVSAPYASFLALMIDPKNALENIKHLKEEGMDGLYGYYEAVDYTPERLGFETKRVIIRSFMAHHQGMSLMAINNVLNQNIMQTRFNKDPYIKAARLLLQEKIPMNVIFTKESKEKVVPFKSINLNDSGAYRKYNQPNFDSPNVHILSNGFYTVMLNDKGCGYSKDKIASITRYRNDSILDHYGMFFYFKDTKTSDIWSSSYAPLNQIPDQYEVIFTPDKASYKRVDGFIETNTEIVIASGDHAELRRITLKNIGLETCQIEMTSYLECILTEQKKDVAHPAFSNLFIETEFNASLNSLIAHRRVRSDSDNDLWSAHTFVTKQITDVQYETDRNMFIGRNQNLSHPQAITQSIPLSNSLGSVLDPIFSLRTKVTIEPNKTSVIYVITSLAQSKESLNELLLKYQNLDTCKAAFLLALTRSQVENEYLNIKAEDMQLYQEMLTNLFSISPLREKYAVEISRNTKGQSSLWTYGISGDHPIVLVLIDSLHEVSIINDIQKAHEYWEIKDLQVDIVIVIDEEHSYFNPLTTLVSDIVQSRQTKNVFLLNKHLLAEGDLDLFYSLARMVLFGDGRSMEEQFLYIPERKIERVLKEEKVESVDINPEMENIELQYFNDWGGFNKEANEYIIHLEKGQSTPAPWSNIIANEQFGFIASESGGGYTWARNSREFKLSTWSNDPVKDTPSEVFYLSDESNELWSMTALPIREESRYTIKHGFGYTEYHHISHGIKQKMVQFVPRNESVKLSLITLENLTERERTIHLTYYSEIVCGVNRSETDLHIQSSLSEFGLLGLKNPYNTDFPLHVYMDCSVVKRSVTGNRREFFGAGQYETPESLNFQVLSNQVGCGFDPCAAMQIEIKLKPYESFDCVFMFGAEESVELTETVSTKYRNLYQVHQALREVKEFWRIKLNTIQVKTPDNSMDILLNGWLMYQVISCRLWARTGFYQAGGAFGFRDQLQDSLSVLYTYPELARAQILKHAAHQFIEGDVQHWWHEPSGKGVRTRISDDYIWLAYVTYEYIRVTQDASILDEMIPFVISNPLSIDEEERYEQPMITDLELSLFEHCEKAMNHAQRFGIHGLPLMGTGDWNDGMNAVGKEGKGESVWLAWFLSDTLLKFAELCESKDESSKADKYRSISQTIIQAVEKHGWDGKWYRRAYYDDGTIMGSFNSRECKIDSISQSWAVLSNLADKERSSMAMQSLEDYLIDLDKGIIRLLTPPFSDGDQEPGYIKGYLPGIRENGGQYTHAATWVIQAFAKMKEGEKAWKLFNLINPINHSENHRESFTYKNEPYVMSADVYSVFPHIGRAGWSWYTGSASWMYRSGIESILGFTKLGNILRINPSIPYRWKEYSITYVYLETVYNIKVLNPNNLTHGNVEWMVDMIIIENDYLVLNNDKLVHKVLCKIV